MLKKGDSRKKAVAQADETQSKISNFFQKGPCPKRSQLFTSLQSGAKGPLAVKSTVPGLIASKKERFRPVAVIGDSGVLKETHNNAAAKTDTDNKLNSDNGEHDVICVPDTQTFFSPKSDENQAKPIGASFVRSIGAEADGKDTSCVKEKVDDDAIVIPDTPELPSTKAKSQRPDFIQRSFLSSKSVLMNASLPLSEQVAKRKKNNRLRKAGTPFEKVLKQQYEAEDKSAKSKEATLSVLRSEAGLQIDYPKQVSDGKKSPSRSLSVKRPSSKGDSPLSKKVQYSHGSVLMRDDNCKRKLSLSAASIASPPSTVMAKVDWAAAMKEVEGVLAKKSQSTKISKNAIETETLLDDVLGEMQNQASSAGNGKGEDCKIRVGKMKTKCLQQDPAALPFTSCHEKTAFAKSEPLAHDGPDSALDDILGELNVTSDQIKPKPFKKIQKISTKFPTSKLPGNCGSVNESDDIVDDVQIEDFTQASRESETKGNVPGTNISVFEKKGFSAAKQSDEVNIEAVPSQQSREVNPLGTQKKRDMLEEKLLPYEKFGRFEVISVARTREAVTVGVKEAGDDWERQVVLKGFWMDTHLVEGDIVHVLGEFDETDTCVIDDKHNLIVVNPDTLISGTAVVSGVRCLRRTIFQDKFRGFEPGNIHLLHGSVIHSLFQEILAQKVIGLSAMEGVAKKILQEKKWLHEMYGQGLTEKSVLEEIHKYLPHVEAWVERYVKSSAGFVLGQKKPSEQEMKIVNIADIEENIWSPRYGIKGKIDLTVEVQIHKQKKTRLVPLELKTGKSSYSIEHQGQVTLYSMMSCDRRDDPESGLLLYLKDGSMKKIPAEYKHMRGLVQLRNELSHCMKQTSLIGQKECTWRLPEPLNSRGVCGRCPHAINCTAFQKTLEHTVHPEGHLMATFVEETLGHLTASHQEYYALWIKMLHLEANVGSESGKVSELWTKTGLQRELHGQCLSNMVLSEPSRDTAALDDNQYLNTFVRNPGHHSQSASLHHGGIVKGDSIVVSAQNKPLIALCQGFVYEITDAQITLTLDRDLCTYPWQCDTVFRLDKCDTYNSMGTNYTNIAKLMVDSPVCMRLRQLIIDCKPPQFCSTMSKGAIEKVKDIFGKLNKAQKFAILKVLMCEDYVLIKGYPGTGKTSTIVALVRILARLGYSVLLASYTHSAVDNILLKLKQYEVDFTRVGRLGRIHPDIHPYAASSATSQFTTVQEVQDYYATKQVVATTCLGANHVVFSQRKFDFCIVDEASQVLQPACLGPLFCSEKFVLVGDPLQLAPVVRSNDARELGMDKSLFARLDSMGGTYELTMQYRMNSEIMRLSNELVYGGALKCGSSAVGCGRLSTSSYEGKLENEAAWLQKCLSPSEGLEVVFVATDDLKSVDQQEVSGVKNKMEAAIVTHLVQHACEVEMSPEDIGVIAPYRQQVNLLRDCMTQESISGVEVNTVDQYQGRDKPLIIVSFVKQDNGDKKSGGSLGILNDMRRLNVAITRAKHKLIMIGCRKVLMDYKPLGQVLQILAEAQCVFISQEDFLNVQAQLTTWPV